MRGRDASEIAMLTRAYGQQVYLLRARRKAFTQALQLQRTILDRRGKAVALRNVARVYARTGDKPRAVRSFSAVGAIFGQIGDREKAARERANIKRLTIGEKGSVYLTPILNRSPR